MHNDKIAEKISNKNEFISLCSALDLPTLPSFPSYGFDDFLSVRDKLHPSKSYILKPMQDRMKLEDQRRRFAVCSSLDELDLAAREFCNSQGDYQGFQIQEYINFRTEAVKYYNVTFNVGAELVEYITTEQIINVSAIHHNIHCLHWGNSSPSQHGLLAEAEVGARRLAKHYFEMGYKGEIGIDFGLRKNSIFFLETNARINNGTRLFYDLRELGIDPRDAHFVFMRNRPMERVWPLVKRYAAAGDVILHERPEDRSLIIARQRESIVPILEEIGKVARSQPPLAY